MDAAARGPIGTAGPSYLRNSGRVMASSTHAGTPDKSKLYLLVTCQIVGNRVGWLMAMSSRGGIGWRWEVLIRILVSDTVLRRGLWHSLQASLLEMTMPRGIIVRSGQRQSATGSSLAVSFSPSKPRANRIDGVVLSLSRFSFLPFFLLSFSTPFSYSFLHFWYGSPFTFQKLDGFCSQCIWLALRWFFSASRGSGIANRCERRSIRLLF